MKKKIIPFLFLLISNVVLAQRSHSSLAYQTLADSLYLHHHYPDATNYYTKALKNSNEQGKIMLQIAKCYVKTNKVNEAYEWFEKAKLNHASFSYDDMYEYVHVLKILKKRNEAEYVLQELLKTDPHDLFAKEALDDLQNFRKYYKDSLAYKIESLSINTPSSEFAPAYYKDGIVFSSAQPGKFGKKKYHWDNSDFLNLYFTKKLNGSNFEKPVVFEEDLDTRFHDGPATFYAGYERMIVNRNRSFKTVGKEDTWLWHLSLYDGIHSKDKNTWQLNALPFDEPPYSFAHPSMSEDGTVLYFISDKPGGYGGTDIYKVVHANGIWGKPFNLGPTINTPENEVFPFFVNNTLYFASNGHGGLGGLDIFKSIQTANGFSPPVNLAFPINSTADDFSLIIEPSLGTGYFSSARNGNDDLFSFRKFAGMVDMVAHIYDGKTGQPLVAANVQITTASGDDITLITDAAGLVHFELPQETGYVIIADKDDKIGLLSGFVKSDEKTLQLPIVEQVPSFADTTRLPCIGLIHDELSVVQNNSLIHVIDETTGEILGNIEKGSMVNFMGKKGHTYKIEVQNEKGDTAIYKLAIGLHDTGSKTWTMTLKKTSLIMAVKVFKADDNQPLAGAVVKVVTFSELDLEFVTNEQGIVEFSLPIGTAYLAMCNKDSLIGMHSGTAEIGMDKNSIIHPLSMRGDSQSRLPVTALLMNTDGEIIHDATATIVDKSNGKKQVVEVKDGLLTALLEPGKNYLIMVEHKDYQTASEEISVPPHAVDVQKVSFVLEKNGAPVFSMAARVFKASDQSALAKAQVKIVTFSEADQNLIANDEGLVDFNLPEKTPYVIIADKDGYTGMYSGVVEKGTDKNSIVHPVAAHNDPENQLGVVGRITNKSGDVLNGADVIVLDKQTGKQVPVSIQDGLLSFVGEKGKAYTVTVSHNNYQPISKEILIPTEASSIEKITFSLDDKETTSLSFAMAARVFKASDQSALAKAQVKIVTFSEADQNLIANDEGLVDFNLPEKTPYVIIADKDGYTGMYSGVVEKGTDKNSIVHPVAAHNDPENQLGVVGRITNKSGDVLKGADVIVLDKQTGKQVPVSIQDGLLSFVSEKGKGYTVTVSHNNYQPISKEILIPTEASSIEKITFSLDDKEPIISSQAMTARVFKASDRLPLSGAKVQIITFNEADQNLLADEGGIVNFTLPEGTPYVLIGDKNGYTGMYSGIANKENNNTVIIHPVATYNDPENQIPVVAHITNKQGEVLRDAKVVAIDANTNQMLSVTTENGMASFMGEKGKEYVITVDHNKYKTESARINIPVQANDSKKITFALEKTESVQSEYAMSARVFKADDNQSLADARVLIMTFNSDDKEYTTNGDGIVDFNMPKGTVYAIMTYKDGFTGMFTGMAEEGTDKASIVHPVPSYRNSQNQIPVVARLANEQGIMLDDAMVIVTGTETGERIPAQLNKGVLTFMGEKGKNYTIAVDHNDYQSLTRTIALPTETDRPEKIIFDLKKRPLELSDSYDMAARVFKADDKLPMSGAKVVIMTFNAEDKELATNSEGLVDFRIPKGTVYAVMTYKDGFTGMFTGRADEGTDKTSIIHSIPSYSNDQNQVPIVGRITNGQGILLDDAMVIVIGKETGEKIPAQFHNGLVTFMGEKGKSYTITIDRQGYQSKSEEINIPIEAKDPKKITFSLDEKASAASNTIIVMKDNDNVKFYVGSNESLEEIVERDSTLYLQGNQMSRPLGKGSLSKLKSDPNAMILSLGLSADKVVTMENIYFDYNKALLDESDKEQLDKAEDLLRRYSHLQLIISAHADSRGDDNYNLVLSKKRAKAIESYLTKKGIRSNRIVTKAYGETAPAVPCATPDCSEEENQKNRRAEFGIRSGKEENEITVPNDQISLTETQKNIVTSTVEETFEKFGDKQVENIIFKLSIGAYRHNHTLTFDELKDLGVVERNHVDGITYYFLGNFVTLNEAKNVRQDVIKRGIKDAVISFFYKGEKISYSTFLSLVE